MKDGYENIKEDREIERRYRSLGREFYDEKVSYYEVSVIKST